MVINTILFIIQFDLAWGCILFTCYDWTGVLRFGFSYVEAKREAIK